MNKLESRKNLGLALLAGLALVWGTGWGLDLYPPVWVDEGWLAEPAWHEAHGEALASHSHGPVHGYNTHVYWMPHLQLQALAGVYRTGADPLMAGRLLSVAAALLTALVLLAWGREAIYAPGGDPAHRHPRSPRAVIWALAGVVVLFLFDPMLWKAHRTIRFEALLGLWSVAAVAWAWSPRRPARALVAGALAGLALSTHPNGMLVVTAVTGVLLLRRQSVGRALLEAVGAGLVAIAVFSPFLWYLWQDQPNGFADVVGQNLPHLHREADVPVISMWAEEWRRYRAYFAWPALALPLALWIATLLAAFKKRAPAALLFVVALWLGGLASLPNKTELYLTLAAPFLFVLAAWVAVRTRRIAWTIGLGALWVSTVLAADVHLLTRDRDCRYREWSGALAAGVPPGSSVAGTFLTWFPLRDHPYLEFHRQRAGDLLEARPEYIVWGDVHSRDPLFDRLRRELTPFLAAHAETVASSRSLCYGDAVLLRPRWDQAPPRASWERWGEPEESP